MFEKLWACVLMAFVFWHSGPVNATAAVPVPLPQLPATFSGTLPCASCEGIQTNITLQADGTFFSRQFYVGQPLAQSSQRFGTLGDVALRKHFGDAGAKFRVALFSCEVS